MNLNAWEGGGVAEMKEALEASLSVKQAMLEDPGMLAIAGAVVIGICECFRAGGKVLFCGNGGSAADAQHLAAELSGRFYFDRDPLPAEALHVNTSYLTAVANDYSYDQVYARLVRACGRRGDVLIALTTSGNSANVLQAAETARQRGMTVVGMTGKGGGALAALCNHLLAVPSGCTPRIQEGHIVLGHIICEQVERLLFPKD